MHRLSTPQRDVYTKEIGSNYEKGVDLLLLQLFHLTLGHRVEQVKKILVILKDLNILLQIGADESNDKRLTMPNSEEVILDVLLLDPFCES